MVVFFPFCAIFTIILSINPLQKLKRLIPDEVCLLLLATITCVHDSSIYHFLRNQITIIHWTSYCLSPKPNPLQLKYCCLSCAELKVQNAVCACFEMHTLLFMNSYEGICHWLHVCSWSSPLMPINYIHTASIVNLPQNVIKTKGHSTS